MLFDTHAHYDAEEFSQDREAVLDGASYGDDILMAILEDEWREIRRTEQIEERTLGL